MKRDVVTPAFCSFLSFLPSPSHFSALQYLNKIIQPSAIAVDVTSNVPHPIHCVISESLAWALADSDCKFTLHNTSCANEKHGRELITTRYLRPSLVVC